MLGGKKTSNEDFGPDNINLLPDDLRAAEEKDKKSSRGIESPYQMRAPKKEKKRKSGFTLLPFFGGTRWGAETDAKRKKKQEAGSVGEHVRVESDTVPQEAPKVVYRGSATPSHVLPALEKKLEEVSLGTPKAKRSFKNGFPLASIFGSRKKVTPRPFETTGETERPPAPMAVRHYSLLEDERRRPPTSSVGETPVSADPIIPAVATTDEQQRSWESHITYPGSKVVTPGLLKGHKKRPGMGFKLPWWVDIFFLVGLLSSGRKPARIKYPKEKHPKKEDTEEKPKHKEQKSPNLEQAMPRLSTRSEITPVVPEKMDKDSDTDRAFDRVPLTPHVSKVKKHKERRDRAWHLPAWLSLSYWFRRKPKLPKAPKPQPEPSPVQTPEVPKPDMSQVPVAPITPEVPTPLPEKVVETKPVIPEAPIIQTAERVEMPVAAPVVTPKPVPRSDDIKSIPTAVPESDRAQVKKKRFGFGKSEKPALGAMFHIPQLAAFDRTTEDAREVNLIPGEFSLRSWGTVGKMMILVFLATAALVAVISGSLTFWRVQVETRTAEIDREIEAFRDDILVYRAQEPEMSAIGTKIDLINELLAQHIYWTNFFSLLEQYTLPDVWYSGLAATTNGTLTLDAHGSSFETVSKTIILLNSEAAKEFVTEATAFDAVIIADEDGAEQVDFSIELTLNPELFYYNENR